MQISRRNFGKVVIALATVAGAVAISRKWPKEPRAQFQALTGRDLPSDVQVSAYACETADNLLRTKHYWLLSGSPGALRQIAESGGFVESLADARAMLPDLRQPFGVRLTAEDVVAGFEWEAERDHWLWLFGDGATALYAH